MDIELQFIAALLKANRSEQKAFLARSLPKGVFRSRGAEINWLLKYWERYGAFPSREAFVRQFKESLPKPEPGPIEASLQPVLDMAMFEQMRDLTHRSKAMLDAHRPVEQVMSFFKNGALKLTTYAADHSDIQAESNSGSSARYRQLVREKDAGSLLTSPWPTLTRMVRFFRGGEYVVIAARLGMGKTWLSVYWCNFYIRLGFRCLYVSKEMPTEQVADRFEALRYRLPYTDFRSANLNPTVLRRWHQARKKPSLYPLVISGRETIEGTGLGYVLGKIEQYKPEVVFLDGAYLFQVTELGKSASASDRFRYLSNRLKALAKYTNTLLFAVVQMNREAEDKHGNAKGSVRSVYNSDAWAQDADGLMDVGGRRGSPSRILSWLKGRESGLGDFNVKFQLDPFPSFDESRGGSVRSANQSQMVKFQGVM
jgi:KaiC/GvpD/RAD55 family RecA-like ATPase